MSGLNLESLLTPLTPPVSQLQVCCNLPCLVLHRAAPWPVPRDSLEFGVPVATGLGGRREWGGPSLLEMQGKPCGGFTWPGVGGEAGVNVGLGAALQAWGAFCVLTCVCAHMCALGLCFSCPFLWVSLGLYVTLCLSVCPGLSVVSLSPSLPTPSLPLLLPPFPHPHHQSPSSPLFLIFLSPSVFLHQCLLLSLSLSLRDFRGL